MKSFSSPEILFEDDHIIVCRKPSGIPTQSSRIGTPDMVSILKNHIGNHPWLAVIHRLDQPVEGILVFAKTKKAAADLNRQLTASGFGKYYLAVTENKPAATEGTLTDYLVKDGRTNMSRVCSVETQGAKKAVLHYEFCGSCQGGYLIRIHLDTGRHHQIRVQMSHMGCPLVGDRKYGSPSSTGQLMLCAYKLEFRHPVTRKQMCFEIHDFPH